MKKIIKIVSLMLLVSMLLGTVWSCDELLGEGSGSNDEEKVTDITITKNKDDLIGMNYKEVEEYFRDLGFTKIELHAYEDEDVIIDGKVTRIKIVDWIFKEEEFLVGDVFTSDCEINIYYEKLMVEEEEEKMTVENSVELELLLEDFDYSVCRVFAEKYEGEIIEFDGHIDYYANHKDYKTRYDVLLSAGDYDPNTQIGPTFKFENVNTNDVGDIFVGREIVITAKVVSFDNDIGIFYLDPVEIKDR